MFYKTVLFLLVLLVTGLNASALQGDSALERLRADFERTKDLGIVYHLARTNFAMKKYDDTARLLTILHESDWKMGLDTAEFSAEDLPANLQQLIRVLNANQLIQSGNGIITNEVVIADPLLVPENVAYDLNSGIMYAGSLVKPRIARVYRNQPMDNDDLPLPATVDWGVAYGMKYHAARDELWVLHNRTGVDGMHGLLTVLTPDGNEVKTYKTPDHKPVEFNDLCFSRGKVYVTDSTASKIYTGDIAGGNLKLYYENADIKYPNGIACHDDRADIFVADFRGISMLKGVEPKHHQRLNGEHGISLGGIDGLYLFQNTLVGVQNYLGTAKVVTTNIVQAPVTAETQVMDVARPEFRIPTTGFIGGECLFYIANSSLDALMLDGSINQDDDILKPAQIMALNVSPTDQKCSLAHH